MKRCEISSVILAVGILTSVALATPVHLRCEYLENPLGIDASSPHLSWQSDNTERNWRQAAYEILVASSDENLRSGKADIWDSGKVMSAESVGVGYRGPTLESRRRYYWKVRVWDAAGQASESAEAAWWEMGLLRPTDWKAKWIRWENPQDEADRHGIRWIWRTGSGCACSCAEDGSHISRQPSNFRRDRERRCCCSLTRGDVVAKVNGHEVDAKSRWATFDRRDIADQLVLART